MIPQILPQTPLSQLQAQAATQQSPMVPASAMGPSLNTPAGVQQNTSQWAKAIDLITQPGITSSLLQFAAGATAPRTGGTSHMGQLGKAAIGTMQGQIGLQENARREKVAQAGIDTAERRTTVAEKGLGLQEKSFKLKQEELEKAEKIRLEEKPLKDRLTEATISLREAQARTAGKTGQAAELQVADALTDALFMTNPEKYATRNDAFLEAFMMAKSTQNTTPQQFRQEIVQTLAESLYSDAGEEELQQVQEMADKLTNIAFPAGAPTGAPPPGTGAPTSEYKTITPEAVEKAQSLPESPEMEAQFDALFGPGKYREVRGASTTAAPGRSSGGRNNPR